MAPKARANKDSRVPDVMTDARRTSLAGLLSALELSPNDAVWPRVNRALMHRSFRTECGTQEDNERLEFLGDSVIGLACTEFLLKRNPDVDEGLLSKLRAAAVSRTVLGEIAVGLGIGPLLLLGTGEERSGGRERVSILGSALEAVCGAIYLSYPWEQIRPPICKFIVEPALGLISQHHVVDYKSRLQEWTQRYRQVVPAYRVTKEGGPDHSKVFEIEVVLDGQRLASGTGRRKKDAENDAARHALEVLEQHSTKD
ncbi:ribonuclease III [Candidatus Sumerlaeota bacterium]|nr:ribonuclease III [Candidatus Sumerlaeota bacterium]